MQIPLIIKILETQQYQGFSEIKKFLKDFCGEEKRDHQYSSMSLTGLERIKDMTAGR